MDELNCVYDHLKFDEACVNVMSDNSNFDTWLYSLSTDCLSCPYKRIARISNEVNSSLKFSTVKAVKWRVLKNDGSDEYISAKITRRWGKAAKEGPSNKEPRKRRVKAIDTFRGASILCMIFINDGSGSYTILGHTTWNGMLPGDLIFPCFIWIMGVCIPIALSAQLRRGVSKSQISCSILKRSFLLFLIGVSLNTLGTNAQLENIRIFGVLQRFGISFLIVGLVYLCFASEQSKAVQNSSRTWITREMQDISSLLPHFCVMLILIIVHCAITFGLPVPECPTGYLGPGGRHEDGTYFNCTGGATGYIDKIVLTLNHVYQNPTIKYVYGTGPFDPEGILGCLTTIFQVFLGVHAGVILMIYKDWKDRVMRWLLWAALYGCLGCAFHFTDIIPVNKNLWSLSFVFVSTSFALAFLSGCYLLVDVTRVWRGGPFRIPGMNALVLYVGHSICYQIFPFHWRIGAMDTRALCFIESIWVVFLWTVIAYIMHHKRTYITL
ncbi:heparan-alpha-glucosaminide N-acetyltransferase isoform X2 [Ooceraea biroi]|uniref:heparan-alpha-glucosaminide N-acetyltransferase isoform X2 n=1 Tax=Ooceraea biroi TaxID=2015173 RepID=UPI0005B770E5|nr:heparan-alpha-glucosaminide N-acetyltransferase isoform X2 [Ooceraea biroi]